MRIWFNEILSRYEQYQALKPILLKVFKRVHADWDRPYDVSKLKISWLIYNTLTGKSKLIPVTLNNGYKLNRGDYVFLLYYDHIGGIHRMQLEEFDDTIISEGVEYVKFKLQVK